MELPWSGVNENGVDQRREAFQSMIKKDDPGRCVPDNSTTRARTRRPPRVWKRCGASAKPTEGKRNQLFFTFKPLLSVSVHGPILAIRRALERKCRQRKKRRGKNFSLSYLHEPLSRRRFIFPAWIYPFLPREGKEGGKGRKRREKERRRRRERKGGGGGGGPLLLLLLLLHVFVHNRTRYIKKQKNKKNKKISSYSLYKSIRGSGSSGSMIRGKIDLEEIVRINREKEVT